MFYNPIQLVELSIFIIFSLISVWALVGFWAYFPNIKGDEKTIELSYFFGFISKSIQLKDIEKYTTSSRNAKHLSGDKIKIFYKSGSKSKIYTSSYLNGYMISPYLNSCNISHDRSPLSSKSAKEKTFYFDRWIFIILGILSLWGLIHFYMASKSFQVDKNELINTEIILAKNPEKIKSGKSSYSLHLFSKSNLEFRFDISGTLYQSAYVNEILSDIKADDTINITITKENFFQKIKKSEPITFWNKHFRYKTISIYNLTFKDREYLSISNYEKEERKDSFWVIVGIFAFWLYLGFVVLKERNKKVRS